MTYYPPQMVLVEPLARSAQVLAHELRLHHPFFGMQSEETGLGNAFGKSNTTIASLGVKHAEDVMRGLLEAMKRHGDHIRGAPTMSSESYRGTLASTLSHMLRYTNHAPNPEQLFRLYGKHGSEVTADEAALSNFRAFLEHRCAEHRRACLPLLREHCDTLVCVLAHDACQEIVQPHLRAMNMATLNVVVQTLTAKDRLAAVGTFHGAADDESAASGEYVAAKVLQVLWKECHLERIVRIATGADAADASRAGLAMGVAENAEPVRASAMALLTQLAVTQLGAHALLELHAVDCLVGSAATSDERVENGAMALVLDASGGLDNDTAGEVADVLADQLLPPCQLLTAMLSSMPPNDELAESVLRWVATVRPKIVALFEPRRAVHSIRSAQAITSIISLLAAVLGATRDPDAMWTKVLGPHSQHQRMVQGAWVLLRTVGTYPHPAAAIDTVSHQTWWAALLPRSTADEDQVAFTSYPCPPGVQGTDASQWSQFDSEKVRVTWALFRAASQFLRRASHLSSSHDCDAGAIAVSLRTCAAVIKASPGPDATGQPTSGMFFYPELLSSAVFVVENLLALAMVRIKRSLPGSVEEKELLDNLLPDAGVSVLDVVCSLRIFSGNSAVAVDESAFFVTRLTRHLVEQLRGRREGLMGIGNGM